MAENWVQAQTPSKFSLRVVKIMRFPTKGSRLYELAFRDGVIMELTPQDVDRAVSRDERIRDGKAVVNNFTDAMVMEVIFSQAQVTKAQSEKINYPRQTGYIPSRDFGSDFSSSSSEEDTNASI